MKYWIGAVFMVLVNYISIIYWMKNFLHKYHWESSIISLKIYILKRKVQKTL